jgi:hypothetical protein
MIRIQSPLMISDRNEIKDESWPSPSSQSGEIPLFHILTYRIQSIVKIRASRKRPKENKFLGALA